MATETPPELGQKRPSEVYDWDFTTPEGRTVSTMVQNEISKAMDQRRGGDLAGATERLERSLEYCRKVREAQQRRATDSSADEKDRLYQLHHAEELATTLEHLVREFKQV